MYKGLLFVLFGIFGVTLAQQTPPSAPAAESPKPLAQMGSYELTEDEFGLIVQMLGANRQTLQPAQKQQIVTRWMQVMAMSDEAVAEQMDKDPTLERQLQLYRRQLLFDRYQRRLFAGISVTDEEVRAYYEQNKDKLKQPAQVRVSRIVVPTKEKADEVETAIKAGTSFEQLAKDYSTDEASKKAGGDIGWTNPERSADPNLGKALSALEADQISEPIETKMGWQIMKVTDKRPAVLREFSEVQKPLAQQLLMMKQKDVFDKAADELFKKHDVKIYGETN